MTNETDYAYAAGLLDGEGYFGLSCGQGYYKPVIAVSMTDKIAILWLQDTFGGNVTAPKSRDSRRELQYRWALASKSTIHQFIPKILSYMKTKRGVAVILLDYCNRFSGHGGLTNADKSEIARYSICIKMLNSRGPGSADIKNRLLGRK